MRAKVGGDMRIIRGDELSPQLSSLVAGILDFDGSLGFDAYGTGQEVLVGPMAGLPIFRMPGWRVVLVPFFAFRFDEPTYRGLVAGSSAAGDDCIVVTDLDGWPELGEAALFQWEQSTWEEVVVGPDIVNVCDCGLFGDSGQWMAYLDHEEFAMIGGSQVFMEAFFANTGGEEAVRSRFLAWGEDYLSNYISPAIYRCLLQLVGW